MIMNRLLPLVLILSSVWMAYSFIKPKAAELPQLMILIGERMLTLEDAEKIISLRTSLLAQYQAVSPENLARLDTLFPATFDSVRMAFDITNLATSHGLEVTAIDVTKPEVLKEVINADGSISPPPVFVSAPLDLSVIGSYENLFAFLTDVERGLRILDMTSISLTSEGKNNEYRVVISFDAYQYTAK